MRGKNEATIDCTVEKTYSKTTNFYLINSMLQKLSRLSYFILMYLYNILVQYGRKKTTLPKYRITSPGRPSLSFLKDNGTQETNSVYERQVFCSEPYMEIFKMCRAKKFCTLSMYLTVEVVFVFLSVLSRSCSEA